MLILSVLLPDVLGFLFQIVSNINMGIDFQILDLLFGLIIISLSYIFEYGYEIQLGECIEMFMMNKSIDLEALKSKTNKSVEECLMIKKIIEKKRIVGRQRKDSIIKDFMNDLALSYKEADNLYNVCVELYVSNVIKLM